MLTIDELKTYCEEVILSQNCSPEYSFQSVTKEYKIAEATLRLIEQYETLNNTVKETVDELNLWYKVATNA